MHWLTHHCSNRLQSFVHADVSEYGAHGPLPKGEQPRASLPLFILLKNLDQDPSFEVIGDFFNTKPTWVLESREEAMALRGMITKIFER